jgi:hypothetical protein
MMHSQDTLDPLDGKLSFPLFSTEFFRTVFSKLSDDGVLLIQVRQLARMNGCLLRLLCE